MSQIQGSASQTSQAAQGKPTSNLTEKQSPASVFSFLSQNKSENNEQKLNRFKKLVPNVLEDLRKVMKAHKIKEAV